MATIISHSELVSRALAFIIARLKDTPQKNIHTLIDEAAMQFNLSPKDTEVLLQALNDHA